MLPLARLMIELGVTTFPEYGLAEFDAFAVLFAHRAGRLTLRPEILDEVVRISRGRGYRPSRAVRRAIEAQARELFSRSEAMLRVMSSNDPRHGVVQ
jgi:hypothetical protein